MLTYQLNKQTFDNDTYNLSYTDVSINDYANKYSNLMAVGLSCDSVKGIKHGDILTVVSSFIYLDQTTDRLENVGDVAQVEVYTVDKSQNKVYFLDSKYKELDVNSITAEIVDGEITWVFGFDTTNYYIGAEDEPVILYVNYGNGKYVYLTGEYVNCHQINWVYDELVENAAELSQILFGDINTSRDDVIEGNIGSVIVTRPQVKWNSNYNQDNPTVVVSDYKVSLNVPISLKERVDLHREGNVQEYFVKHEYDKAVNTSTEMEKFVYTPVVVKSYNNNTPVFVDCMKINFNLHFREHSGKDWTVADSDTWNFVKYGDNSNWSDNKYYSYLPAGNRNSVSNVWDRSCQADLLGYVGFETNDVKYQKNKLKKSFIRLSFYDSDVQGSQNLLAYSTVFVDCNKLYSKFISRMNFNCYYDGNGDVVKGVKVDREVSLDDLKSLLNTSTLVKDEIEDYRLSSQLTVKNKFTSDNSSEGFYLYMWENVEDRTIPTDVYMKVEFNHAGYGRNIPMMAPYKDGNERGFKTNIDIINDWSSPETQYGIKKYMRYSYIHLKAKYDTNTKRHIYYLDPETYGAGVDGNTININLYEARIAFK